MAPRAYYRPFVRRYAYARPFYAHRYYARPYYAAHRYPYYGYRSYYRPGLYASIGGIGFGIGPWGIGW